MKRTARGKGLRPLPHDAPGPLYRQVRRALQQSIEAGTWRPGDALPSEAQIAGKLGVSIGTLRKAVDELVLENVLVRRQGKGTFVVLHNPERFLFQFFPVQPRRDLQQQEPAAAREYPRVELLGFAAGRADENEAALLRIRPAEPVLRIDNRLSLAGRPVVHDRLSVSAALFKGLDEKRLRERPSTLYSLYQTAFGITVLRAEERVRAVAVGAQAARVLGMAAGLPALEVHRVALTFGGRPVEYRVSTVRTDLHDYVALRS